MSDDQISLDKARKIFDRISQVFNEQNITPNPLNYQVWYEYFKGDKPKFRQEMDTMLNHPDGYNDRTGRRLFNEYLKDGPVNSELDRVFKRLLDAMIKRLTSWTEKLENQTQQLDFYANSLAQPDINPEKLKQITDSILNTTNNLRDHNRGFQRELINANEEVISLRQQLIAARAESMKDELTELGNRRAFNLALDELTEQFATNPQQLHLILTDIDHFKSFNDRFGHLVGDSVLRYFANLMRKQQKSNQTLCRYGGEEFAIILPNSTLQQTQQIAETIRLQIEKANLKRKDTDETLPPITASFGIAQYRAHETIELFVKRADDMLYQAKRKGRNCIVSEFDVPSA